MRAGLYICTAVLMIGAGLFVQQRFFPVTNTAVDQDVTVSTEQPPRPPLTVDVVGQARPEFSLPDITGELHSIKEWDGKVLVVNFWATWCLPCLKEIPELISLQSRFGDRGLQVIGIALQDPGEIGGFMREQGMDYPVLAGEAPVIAIAEQFGNTLGALPYTAVIDRTGIIVYTHTGPVTEAMITPIISSLL